MSLIKCKECGKKISSTAKRCPNCGWTTNNGRNFIKKIFVVILVIIIFVLLIIFGFKDNNKIVGKWVHVETISNVSKIKINMLEEGKITTTYSFDSDGKCVESIVKKSNLIQQKDDFLHKAGYTENNDYTYNTTCKYKLKSNNKKIIIFDLDLYNSDKEDYNDCLINPDDYNSECEEIKPIKEDYEDEYEISITDNILIIDGDKYEKK